MNRVDRLSAILIQLQSKRVVKAREISHRFGISLRTVYRDIKALEQAGVPIGAEAGVGYFIADGYYLPPVKFSKSEAGAILMAAKLAEKQTDKSIWQNLNSALFKIRSALKEEEKEYLETIEDNIEVLQLVKPPETGFPDHFLADIQLALATKKVINFDYYSSYRDSFTNRDVEPVNLCYYSRHWHLVGFCKLRNALRDFRSDRIMKLTIKEQTFDASKYHEFQSLQDLYLQGEGLQEVVIRVTSRVADYISEQKYFMGFVESKREKSFELMKFMCGDVSAFAHWLLQFNDGVTVISPDLLKEKVFILVEKAFIHHKNYQS